MAGRRENFTMPRRGEILLILLAAGLGPLSGCFVAQQALREVRGAQARVLPIQESGPATMGRFRGIEVLPATTSAGPQICPPELLRAYDRLANQLPRRLQREFPGGPPTLTIESEILYFQGKGLLSGAFMLTRVRMRAEDRLTTDVMVKSESAAFTAGGEEALAGASVEALEKFLSTTAKPR
jgi:hypothetical protein